MCVTDGGVPACVCFQISDAEWDDLLEEFEEKSYLSAQRWKPGDDPYKLYAFNQRESERIPSNRALRDTRHYRCSHTHIHPYTHTHTYTHTPRVRITGGFRGGLIPLIKTLTPP